MHFLGFVLLLAAAVNADEGGQKSGGNNTDAWRSVSAEGTYYLLNRTWEIDEGLGSNASCVHVKLVSKDTEKKTVVSVMSYLNDTTGQYVNQTTFVNFTKSPGSEVENILHLYANDSRKEELTAYELVYSDYDTCDVMQVFNVSAGQRVSSKCELWVKSTALTADVKKECAEEYMKCEGTQYPIYIKEKCGVEQSSGNANMGE